MISKLKERFELIDVKEVWKYLENVVIRFPNEAQKELLKNRKIEIISPKEGDRGFQISFRNPVESLILWNWSAISNLSDLEKTYGIAHEIAHHFAGRGTTGLREMEAEDLQKKWGFEKEIEAANHFAPIFQKKGFEIGYEFADENLASSDKIFMDLNKYLNKWNTDTLKDEDEDKLWKIVECLLKDSGAWPLEVDKNKDEKIAKKIREGKFNDKDKMALRWGIICGVMVKVKEIEGKKIRNELETKFKGE